KGSKTTISPVFAVAKASPSAAHHPMIFFSGRTPSFTIRRRCSSVTVDLCHTCSGGGISTIGEKRDRVGVHGKLSRRRKTPNPTAALKTGATAEDGRRKQRKLRRRK